MALTGLTQGIHGDYNIMNPEDLDELLFSGYDIALGDKTRDRIAYQIENYEYYGGKQHRDESGNLVHVDDLERPQGLDYDPTRVPINYFKGVIDRKARWQMSGNHVIEVPRKQIDNPIDTVVEGYEPSAEQLKENERAQEMEDLINQLWRENKMRANLLKSARDRIIADRVVCKIVYNPRNGKLRWIWRPDYEYIPVYSDDDFEDQIGAYFVTHRTISDGDEEVEAIKLQAYMMHDEKENGEYEAYLHEAIYTVDDLKMVEAIIPSDDKVAVLESNDQVDINGKKYMPLGLDFLPIVEVPIDDLLGSEIGDGEVSELRVLNDLLNQMNEDAIDSLKFEMFSMTAIMNATPGTSEDLEIAPGAVVEAVGLRDGLIPEIRKIESGFRWKEAHKEQYTRIKNAMHEISGLPLIMPEDMNFGGMNAEALRLLYQDIIADTEEQWLVWENALEELHEKSIKYLQARIGESNFSYDKDVIRGIEDYETDIKFVLPLPDNRNDLVTLLTSEMSLDLESKAGAMRRLGVTDVETKMKEIQNEKMQELMAMNVYAGEVAGGDGEVELDDSTPLGQPGVTTRLNDNGEEEVLCDECGGSGTTVNPRSGDVVTCPKCRGSGWFQPRKR